MSLLLSLSSKIKSNIISVRHTLGVNRFLESIQQVNDSFGVHNELFELIRDISKIQNLEEIKYLIEKKSVMQRIKVSEYLKMISNEKSISLK